MDVVVLLVRVGVGAMFLIAALAKLSNVRRMAAQVRLFGVPESMAWPAAIGIPVAELVIVALIVPVATARLGGALGALGLLGFAAAAARLVARGEEPDCNCFGVLVKTRVGPAMVVRNLALAVCAGLVAAVGPGTSLGLAFWAWAPLVAVAGIVTVLAARVRERRARVRPGVSPPAGA